MESILVALIGGAVTLAGVVASNSRSRAVLEQKVDELSRRVINGEFGNGDARKVALGALRGGAGRGEPHPWRRRFRRLCGLHGWKFLVR